MFLFLPNRQKKEDSMATEPKNPGKSEDIAR